MIKITNNWDDYLQAYASAHSGESSGESKQKEKLSIEKVNDDSHSFGNTYKSSHVRYNSLVDNSNKYNTQKKLKFKNGAIAKNEYREPLGKVDTNAPHFANNSAPFFQPEIGKNHNFYQKHTDEFKNSSEGAGLLNYSYENLQGNQGLEGKDHINLLESHNTIEHPMEEVPPLTTMMFNNRICK